MTRLRPIEPGDAALCAAAADAAVVAERLSAALGVVVPQTPGEVAVAGTRRAFWLSPRAWLVQAATGEHAALCAAVATAFPDGLVHAVPYGDGLAWFSLEGEGSEDLLRQGGFISLEPRGLLPGHCKRTLIADVPLLVWRSSADDWRLGVERSLAASFAAWVEAAARPFP